MNGTDTSEWCQPFASGAGVAVPNDKVGATVSRFLEADLLDRLQVAVAPLVTGSGRPGVSLPARDTIAECLRPSHRVFAMGSDVLFDCDLRAAAEPPREHGNVLRVT